MKAKTMLAVVVALVCAGTLIAGNVCTWQGGSGKFSDANWDTAPVSGNGDTIYFDTTDGSPITVENDIADDFTVEKVQFAYKATSAGDCGKVTLTGKSLVVRPSPSKISIVWDHGDASDANNRGPEVDVDVPITFENWSVVQVSKNLTFNRKVTLTGSYLYLRWPGGMSPVQFSGTTGGIPAIYFKDEVYGPNTEIRNEAGNGGAGSEIYYHGKVSAKIFYICDIVWGFVKVHLCHPENSIGTVSERYAQLYLDSSPCLGADTAIVLRDNDASATVYATADDVVCDRVTCGNLSRHQTVGDNNASGKLTMRAKADGASGVNFTQTLSIVYDPQGDCTYTLTNSTSTTTGSLEIKGGTFKLAGNTTFSALSEVIVRDGATLDLSECTTTPFATTTKVTVDLGGKIVAPVGGVTFGSVYYKGIWLAADNYSSTDDWVEGGTVTTSVGPGGNVVQWTNSEGGDWNVAANWTPAVVPGEDSEARITVQGASDYTVSFAGTETKPAKIVVGTGIASKATLSVVGEADFTTHTLVEVNRGGEIAVPAGGRFVYDQALNSSVGATLIKIDNGRFVVDGGYAMITNSCGFTQVSGADGELLVSGGELVLADRNTGSANACLKLVDGATLRMTGGSIVVPARSSKSYLDQSADSVCDFSGGTLCLNRGDQANYFRFSGDVTFSDSSVCTNNNAMFMTVAPKASDKAMTLVITDNAKIGNSNTDVNGGFFAGGLGETMVRMDSTGTLFGGMQGNVGFSKGKALFRQTAGDSLFGWRGLCVGMTKPNGSLTGSDVADNAVTGTVEIVGGAVCVLGTTTGTPAWGWSTAGMFPPGTVLGYGGTAHPPASGRPYVGCMTISETGSLTNRYGHLLVGVAPYGEGSLVMDGGTLRSTCERVSVDTEIIACAVGVGGGKGEIRIRGGDCQINNNVWIGGAATNAVRVTGAALESYPYEVHGGEGLLEVSGGSVVFGRDLVVGADGTGVVSVVGSTISQFNVARNLVLSNEAAVVVGGAETATLKFKPDAGGITPIGVTGKFVVTDTAKLEIDLSDYNIKSGSLNLLTCSSKEGNFAPSRVVLTGCNPDAVKVNLTNTGISVGEQKGFVIFVR